MPRVTHLNDKPVRPRGCAAARPSVHHGQRRVLEALGEAGGLCTARTVASDGDVIVCRTVPPVLPVMTLNAPVAELTLRVTVTWLSSWIQRGLLTDQVVDAGRPIRGGRRICRRRWRPGDNPAAGDDTPLKATRAALKQGTADTVEGQATTSVVYDVPLSGATAPY